MSAGIKKNLKKERRMSGSEDLKISNIISFPENSHQLLK